MSEHSGTTASVLSGNTNPYDKMMQRELAEQEAVKVAKPIQRDAQAIMVSIAMKFEAKVGSAKALPRSIALPQPSRLCRQKGLSTPQIKVPLRESSLMRAFSLKRPQISLQVVEGVSKTVKQSLESRQYNFFT